MSGPLAVVTGGGRGIGRAVVADLAGRGMQVVAVGRDRVALEETADAEHVTARVCDITDEAAVGRLFDDLGEVDVLVANAGMAGAAPLHATALDDWRAHLEVNATGVFLCVRAVIAGMRARRRGRIVTVASTAALRGAPYIGAYAASKHAALGVTRVAAAELAGTGATANAVCPTYVRTPMTERSVDRIIERTGRSREEALAALEGASPLGRLLEPQEVAAAVAYLVSDEAGAVNGQTIVLDGGGTFP